MPETAGLSRKERDQQRRREDLLAAAEHLFGLKGYHHTTMEDIAHEAQYGTGTIYLYFKKKEELYEALLERKIGDYVEFVQGRVESVASPIDKVRTLLRAKLEFFEKHMEFFRIYLAEMTTADSTLHRSCNERRERMYYAHQEFVARTLSDAMQAGAIREVDPTRLATAFEGVVNPLLSEWIKQRSRESLCVIESFVIDLLLKGLEKK